jgi:HlyD family secretion protein
VTTSTLRRGGIIALVLIGGVAAVLWFRAARTAKPKASVVTFEAVERRTLTSTIEATGTVEPINLVEVKSKASGQIIRMPVEVGTMVKSGQLLVQIDPVDTKNQYRQAEAALKAAQVQAKVAAAQRERAETLFQQGILTAPEHEGALLSDASAQSALVRARTDLENARLRLDEATVRAPIAGTVLEKPVAVGQVIASATSSVSGGTTLLKMADLRKIRVRALVPESDIGGVHEGMDASVAVDAFPNRNFRGRIEKVEPQAVVQQSVTMFPVLLSIDNEDGLLLPGMNGEVVVTTATAMDALSIPADAVRSMRELNEVAIALGVPADSLRAGMRSGAGPRGAGDTPPAAGDTSRAVRGGPRAPGEGERTGRMRSRGRGESDSLGARARRNRGGGGTSAWTGGSGRAGGTGGSVEAAGGAAGGRSTRNSLFVVTKVEGKFRARRVRIGVNNFDYVEVLSGLAEGDSVALLGAAQMQAERDESLQRIRQRVGTGLPGSSGGTGRGGGGASGGGRRGGG